MAGSYRFYSCPREIRELSPDCHSRDLDLDSRHYLLLFFETL
jgi:hypothetical protein